MKICWKLMILLLAIALVPLMIGTFIQRRATRRLGNRLATDTREILTENARGELQRLVDDFGRILTRDKRVLELALRIQAIEVQWRLAGPPPAKANVFFSKDYDGGVRLPDGMEPSDKHSRAGPDGKPRPIQVTYAEQVYFVVDGVSEQAVAGEIARLSTMAEVYRSVYQYGPSLIYWQYTSLASGFHTSYPGHGGYPVDYDPRARQWYLAAKEADGLTWIQPMPEVSTRTTTLALAMPVRGPDGSFAGVTAIDVPLDGIFKELDLPRAWAGEAWKMLVVAERRAGPRQGKLVVLAQKSYERRREDWREEVRLAVLESDDTRQFEAMKTEALTGRSGVRKMPFRGRDALWAYGAGGGDGPFPVVIVPYARIVAKADQAEQHVLDGMALALQVTGLTLLGVVVVVAAVALLTARSVTRPVIQLAEAGEKLAAGDYDVRVDIRTGDELQKLGEVFNATGPKLKERERMKHAMALATEIQQHLLPLEAPTLTGFDIAGRSVYCDETGGDYYDFIELMGVGPDQLGVAVGDVTGHGIGAALLMASARGVLRSHAGLHGRDLGDLFGTLNTHLVRDTGDARFMTLFYGVIDARARTLQWTSGGHDPALWLRRHSGQIEELPNTGIPLGVIAEATYGSEGPLHLDAGDVIIIGTDGIWESANAGGELYGKDRMREVLTALAERSAQDIYAAIVESARAFRAAEPQKDDVTLVVIKCL